ncbi:Homeobox protein 4 [Colletotrichum trifolii]|uniref:Homeobox protein 4 n=1 Tax=Colletotrichum trifolii TaxID=5466 RepID=A0A4R8RGM5_COLTR|nr:Homeobox protein 4 [Colletotrichum trifolii]
MDVGTVTANDGNPNYIDDNLTAALEFGFLTSNLASGTNFECLEEGHPQSTFVHDLQRPHDALTPQDVLLYGGKCPPWPTGAGESERSSGSQAAAVNETTFNGAGLLQYAETFGGQQLPDAIFAHAGSNPLDMASHPAQLEAPPKIGTRFSSKSLRFLKTWLTNNNDHPYPTTADMEMLERQTGLSRQQITNWLANTRRRNRFKNPPKRPPSPAITSLTATSLPVDIQPGTQPSREFDQMDPMQRWQVSPPEHEPASVSAIANAVYEFPSGSGPSADLSLTDSAPARSMCHGSSASSAGTSHSSRSSVNSAYSFRSRGSFPHDPLGKSAVKRRRRRAAVQQTQSKGSNTLAPALNTYQCTFCTETFKTKHNWQRHEKSLHLSLERWECCPRGPTIPDASGRLVCVFCRDSDPNDDHLDKHNYSVCKERTPEDRLFCRKDHLQQHLKLVHDSKFLRWPMGNWKHENELVRSRCGFCASVMSSWSERADHLAEHFKDGMTMENWHGDWGFENHVLKMVENSVAPYMIHMERHSPWPFTTTQGVPETPPNAFELIKLELHHFAVEHQNLKGRMPTNAELLYESCCVIFGAELTCMSLARRPTSSTSSWLRDLLTSSEALVKQARTRPLKTAKMSRITYLSINGKGDIFEDCALEDQLRNYVEISKLIEPVVTDQDLQREACSIVGQMEAASPSPSETFAGFLTGLINASNHWLAPFRRRNGLPELPRSQAATLDVVSQEFLASAVTDVDEVPHTGTFDGSAPGQAAEAADAEQDPSRPATAWFINQENCYRRLALELTRFVKITISPRNPNQHIPSDAELQHQARWISFEDDDPWNQTPADNPDWLREFRREMGILEEDLAS